MKDYKSKYGTEIKYSDVLEMERSGLSDPLIADHYEISRMGFIKIRRKMGWVRKYPGVRRDKGVARKSSEEKRENYNRYMRGYNRSNGIKRSHSRIGKKIYSSSRLAAESELLGRGLLDGEVVHHIDGNEKNDDPVNLMVFASQGDHLKYHRGEEVEYVAKYHGECVFCGVVITLANFGIEGDGKYVCGDCCRKKFEKGERQEEELKAIWKYEDDEE